MYDPLQYALIGGCLLATLVVLGYAATSRMTDDPLLYGLGVLEAGLLVQTVVGVVQLVGTDRAVDGPTFVGYLIGASITLPAAAFWSLAERSRAGTAVLAVGTFTTAFLVFRLLQIWG